MKSDTSKIRIHNVIATFKINKPVNLDKIHKLFPSTSLYNEAIFNKGVVVLKVVKPKMSFLIYRTGTIICTGAKSIDSAKRSDKTFMNLINDSGLDLEVISQPSINNIVSSIDIEKEINLNNLAIQLGLEHVEYEPEQFPGLIYRREDPKVVFLIFGNGKIVIVGSKSEEDLKKGIEKFYENCLKLVM